MARKKTTKEFITEAIAIHGTKYDYSLVEYTNNKTKVKIICKEHGIFEQVPSSHLKCHGCIECAGKQKSSSKEFIKKSISVHGEKYDYSLVEYVGTMKKVKIVCNTHGIFEQVPSSHLSGFGCPDCGMKKSNSEEFIKKSFGMHGDKYDYSLVDYIDSMKKVKIVCNTHGIFEQTPNSHLSGAGCPKCVSVVSKPENEIFEFVKTLTTNVIQSERKMLNGKELDIFCADDKIAIEYNGLYWHSSHNIESHYKIMGKHEYKTQVCNDNGFRLFHIFENEWIENKDIWKSVLTNAFGLSEFKTVSHECEIDAETAIAFFNENSFEKTNDAYAVGYFAGVELIAVLSNDMLVYKKYVTSDIQPDFVVVNNRFPIKTDYSLVSMSEPVGYFHKDMKMIDVDSIQQGYEMKLSCIFDCGYSVYTK
ncbi:MAG: hypothetical protein ACRC3J_05660 [Culicoidibacterales bacterium]